MYLDATNIEQIGSPRREGAGTARPRVSLLDRWHAFLQKLHEIACLPELGGCEEELVDIRTSREGAVADR